MLHLGSLSTYGMRAGERYIKTDEKGRVFVWGKGSRKRAKATCRLFQGSGKIVVNNRSFIEYFAEHSQRFKVVLPLDLTLTACEYDIELRVHGGGVNCQADAAQGAIVKALIRHDKSRFKVLHENKLTLVDYRQVEAKKTGLYKARRKWTYKRR